MTLFKGILLCLLVPIAGVMWYRQRSGKGRRLRWLDHVTLGLLVVMALLAVSNYYAWSPSRFWYRVDGYDLFHYYLNGKYFDELSYHLLYHCAFVADAEGPKHFRTVKAPKYRNLKTYERRPKREALRQPEVCHAEFTADRWNQFQHDLAVIQPHVHAVMWDQVLTDRGMNGSPVWVMVGGGQASVVPASQMHLLTKGDVLALLAAFLALGLAFGPRTALASAIFVFATYSTAWPIIGAVLMRYDWVAATLIGLAAMQKDRPLVGGLSLAYATSVRLFPAVFVVLPFARLVWTLVSPNKSWKQRLWSREARLAAGYLIGLVLLVGAAGAVTGPQAFTEFAGNIKLHTDPQNISFQRQGLPVALQYRGEVDVSETKAKGWWQGKKDGMKKLSWIVRLLALALFVFWGLTVARRQPIQDLAPLGFALFVIGFQASIYYYVISVVMLVYHLRRIDHTAHLVGFAALIVVQATHDFMVAGYAFHYTRTAITSVMFSAYVLVVVGLLVWEGRSGGDAADEPGNDRVPSQSLVARTERAQPPPSAS